ncbi:FtsX-like permease family protein [Nocardioides anomalus]|uniref:FtsX-like permease family protein n=1 Tax=Nocardioides anomalus TaxID=2712223 RepID=UPI001E4AC6FF|nr:FtsX-like permease family protein [Nocardioides anomalus]
MLTLVLRRARGQSRLVASVVALVAVAATLLGVCALLLGPTQDRAFARELRPSPAQHLAVDAFLVTLRGDELEEVRATAADQLREVLGRLDPDVTVVETSTMRGLPGAAEGYLAAGDGIAPRSRLVTGRWPDPGVAVTETTVPEAAARRLGLVVGSQVRLAGGSGLGGAYEPITVVVVGTFRPRSAVGWESDPLTGAGAAAGEDDEGPVYGPFVVDDAAFLDSGSPVARLRVTAQPDPARLDRASVRAAVAAYDGAGDRLAADLADRVQIARLTSRLPATLERVEAQRAAGRSTVLVAVLLGAALSLAALLLAGRLVAVVRDEERVLLVALGASRRQQLGAAALEALLLALLAAALALPSAALLHAALVRTGGPAAAGLAEGPLLTRSLVTTVLGCALLPTPALVLTALDGGTTAAATRGRWARTRAGVDVALPVVAALAVAVGWWQLRQQPTTSAARGDLTLVLAPVVCVAAAVLLVVRVVPALLRAVARRLLRSVSLLLPLSVQQAARRPHPGTALVLVAASVAAATFGLGAGETWSRSQADQADLRVGTDLRLDVPTVPSGDQARAVADAVGRATLSGAVDRAVAVGQYVGTADGPPTLVAVDSRAAGDLLRGRIEDGSWAGVGARLDPGPAPAGVVLADGVSLQGRVDSALPVTATVTAVVSGAGGLRPTLTSAPLPLDGGAHPVTWSEPPGAGVRLVALGLHFDAPRARRADELAAAAVEVGVALPGAEATGAWQAPAQPRDPVRDVTVGVEPAADGARLVAAGTVESARLSDGGGDLVLTAYAAPDAVPVALSHDLADAVDAGTGDTLVGTLVDVDLPLEVVAVVPQVPSAPGRPAVLADADAVSRTLIAGGHLEPVVDGWWVGEPGAGTERALEALGLGEVTSRRAVTDDLLRGPFEVLVPTVLATLVAASVVLLLAGVALATGADQRRRAGELTRLRALGLRRPEALRVTLVEHAAFLGPLVLLGLLVGAGSALVLGPLLVRSDLGSAPVPSAVADWPWGVASLVLGGALAGAALVSWLVARRQVRASDHAGLRTGDA